MLRTIKSFFLKLILNEHSSHKLALSFCTGNFIAFSPFIGFHGIMVVMFSWLFSLNFTVTFTAAYFINNLWTAIPVYSADYLFGYWLVHNMFHLNVAPFTPAWMNWASTYLEQQLGLPKPCFWSFLIGGNILGILISIALYPGMQFFFSQLLQQKNENNSSK